MAMPETTVNKDRRFPFWKNQIRRSRKIFAMEAKPQAERMDNFSHDKLRSRILSPDARH